MNRRELHDRDEFRLLLKGFIEEIANSGEGFGTAFALETALGFDVEGFQEKEDYVLLTRKYLDFLLANAPNKPQSYPCTAMWSYFDIYFNISENTNENPTNL